jgi:virulence-associated protein VapD
MSNLNLNTQGEKLAPDTEETQNNMIQRSEYYEYLKNIKMYALVDQEDFSTAFIYL